MKRIKRSELGLVLTLCIAVLGAPVLPAGRAEVSLAPQSKTVATLLLIVVMDGLRPDSINREDTPTLFRLREQGVSYLNSHSVFPTVTRVNAAAISTGDYPDVNGLVSNSMFVPGVHPTRAFSTGDFRQLLKLREVSNGRLLFARSLAERLTERGIRFAAVSSGSTGSAFLLNHHAPEGVGVLVNGNFDPGRRVAYPDGPNAIILSRFGVAPREEDSSAVDWADRVLREYVLPELHPEVVIDWQTEPDGSEHRYGTGSPQARSALANNDRNLALTLATLKDLGLADKTDLIVLSDHGFSVHNFKADANRALINAGLKSGTDSDDVVVASNGQSVLVHVKGRDSQRIAGIVRFLQTQDWADVIFTAERKPDTPEGRKASRAGGSTSEQGWVPGTFSLRLIREASAERGPDILFTLPWSSAANAFGVPGRHYIEGDGNAGPLAGPASGHGGMSPWVVRTTLLLWGPDFKHGITVRTPAANVDIAPTILALKGLNGAETLDGRVLAEAFRDGPDEEQVPSETRLLRTEYGAFRAAIQITNAGKYHYIDKGWRIR